MQRFVVFGRGRSGTTVLADELSRHPQIRMSMQDLEFDGFRGNAIEGFLKRPHPEADDAIRQLAACERVLPFDWWKLVHGVDDDPAHYAAWIEDFETRVGVDASTRAIGIKVISTHFAERPGLLDLLIRRNWRFVWIVRTNLLRHALSQLIAVERKVYNARNFDVPDQKYRIDPKVLEAVIHDIAVETRKWAELFRQHRIPVTLCRYENFLSDRANFYAPILGFLGVERTALPDSDFTRMVGDDLSQVVENFDEIVKLGRALGYEVTAATA